MGETPLRFGRRMRLEQAHQRAHSTDLMTEVARSVGYSASGDIAQALGINPADERQGLRTSAASRAACLRWRSADSLGAALTETPTSMSEIPAAVGFPHYM